jgi:uncharacterized membrane-anchored protein
VLQAFPQAIFGLISMLIGAAVTGWMLYLMRLPGDRR